MLTESVQAKSRDAKEDGRHAGVATYIRADAMNHLPHDLHKMLFDALKPIFEQNIKRQMTDEERESLYHDTRAIGGHNHAEWLRR